MDILNILVILSENQDFGRYFLKVHLYILVLNIC